MMHTKPDKNSIAIDLISFLKSRKVPMTTDLIRSVYQMVDENI